MRLLRALAPASFALLALACAQEPAPSVARSVYRLPPCEQAEPCAKGPVTRATGGPAKRTTPLVVAVVIDQLPMWLAKERWQELPANGGFARLRREASGVRELRFRHAHNATAPGHAALFTGASPHDSGITANGRLDAAGQYESALLDRATRLVSGAGTVDRPGASLATLRAPTIADALREAKPEAFIASVSIKDRGALFGGGRKPDASLWFDAANDGFVTSTAFASPSAFAPRLPAWAEPFTQPGYAKGHRTVAWTPLDPAWLGARVPPEQWASDRGEGNFHGLGAHFPHGFEGSEKPSKAFVATPFADAAVVEVAARAIDAATARDVPSLVAISLSAHDYIAHVFGPDAPEAWDELLRLDRLLATLQDRLDASVGPSGWAMVLSSDHGGPSTPEAARQRPCTRLPDPYERPCDGVRLQERDLARIAEEAADRALGPGDWVLGASEPFVVLRPALRADSAKRDRAVAAIVPALTKLFGIERAVDVRQVGAECPPDGGLDARTGGLDALICRSIAGETGGDIFVVTEPGTFIDTGYVEGDGCNHGSPWLFDRAVPIVVRSPAGVTRRSASVDGELAPVDDRAFAASVSALLGIEAPPSARGGANLSAPALR